MLGIPLVELETVNGIPFVSDNLGRVAIKEPGFNEQEVYFSVTSHGYESPKDGFGFQGIRVRLDPNKPQVIKLKRNNLAERVIRLTGEGRYRDSLLLGYEIPIEESKSLGLVAGQDSIQTAIYQNKIYWLWGDTQFLKYPLGIFRMSGATTPLINLEQLKQAPEIALKYQYFTDSQGYSRNMMPHPEKTEGVIWIESIVVLKDEMGQEKMLAHYSRRKGLADQLEQGIAQFDDEKQIFISIKTIPLEEKWRFPHGHPVVLEDEGIKYFYFGSPNLNVRVKATIESVLDPLQYEAFTCFNRESQKALPARDEKGYPQWTWQKELSPVTSETEFKWIKSGYLKADEARFCPRDIDHQDDVIKLHRGTVYWNDYRQKYVMIAGQLDGKNSMLGEIWYSESESPTGPFKFARKIVTHDKQTFYNPCQHKFMDTDGGRVIYFEGTYTNDFSGNKHKTMRYNYNQILYKLDLEKVAGKFNSAK